MSASNSRIGFRYYDEGGHYAISELEQWLPKLTEFSASWLVLPSAQSEIIPEQFIQVVQASDVRPIIHVMAAIGSLADREIRRMLNAYARYGVSDVVIYDKPNDQASWPEGDWSDANLIHKFTDIMIPVWNRQVEMGMNPIFPPLTPGGDYWDTAFLEAALVSISQKGHEHLLQQMRLASYAWSFGQPLNWGAGGPARWPQTRPYHTPDTSQDHRGMHIFDWYEVIASQAIGIALPIIVVAGGSTVADQTRPSETAEIIRMLNAEEISTSVIAFAFPLFGRATDELQSRAAWQDDQPAPKVKEQALIKSPGSAGSKRYQDYILLPKNASAADWPAIAQFAQARASAIGFSAQDAAHAQRVWILADDNEISDSVEQTLVEGGCQVSRRSESAADWAQ